MQPHRATLESLTRRVRVLERGSERTERPPLATGWPGVDGLLGAGLAGAGMGMGAAGGLAHGAVHEWLGLDGPRLPSNGVGVERTRGGAAAWTPPLFLLAHLARRALAQASAGGGSGGDERWILWIGRRVWPYPRTLTRGGGLMERVAPGGGAATHGTPTHGTPTHGTPTHSTPTHSDGPLEGTSFALELADVVRGSASGGDRTLLEHSLFVDPPDRKGLLWAVDAALRCPTVAAVVADGSNLPMPASRRLQLAAEAGSGLCLLARPPDEVRQLSAATTRWRVRRGGLAPAGGSGLAPAGGDGLAPAGGDGLAPAGGGGEMDDDELVADPEDRPRWDLELLRCKPGAARVAVTRAGDGARATSETRATGTATELSAGTRG